MLASVLADAGWALGDEAAPLSFYMLASLDTTCCMNNRLYVWDTLLKWLASWSEAKFLLSFLSKLNTGVVRMYYLEPVLRLAEKRP